MRLKYIDGLSVDGKAVVSHVAALLNRKLDGFFIGGVRWLKGNEREDAIAEFETTLHRLVDQWIDSGRVNLKTDGERPWERGITWKSSEYPKALFEVIYKFWQRNPCNTRVELRGENTLLVGPKPSSERLQDSIFMAREYAIFEFERLRTSESPERLSRCDNCGTYYVRARTPKKGKAIFHGTFCRDCQGKGGARRTAKSRKDRTLETVIFAAEVWPKWVQSHRQPLPQREWVANQVNKKFSTDFKKKWVSHHLAEILERVEALKDAKG